MNLQVWMPRTSGEAFDAALREALDPAVHLVGGRDRPDPPDYDVIVEGRPTAEDLDASPNLGLLVIPWSGLPPDTRQLLLERPGIAVHNIHHNAPAAAEMAVGLLLAAARRLGPADRALRQGDWRIRYETDKGLRLVGRTALVIGHGEIGRRVAHVLVAFDMRVLAVCRHHVLGSQADAVEIHPVEDLDGLLVQADVVVVSAPSTAETVGLLDARRLALLPRGAVLVNVARGEVVDEEALYEAFRSGHLAAGGLDVWYRYPQSEAERKSTLPSRLPFHELDNVVLSPHRAGHGSGTEAARAEHLAALLNAAARGATVPHPVDVERGY